MFNMEFKFFTGRNLVSTSKNCSFVSMFSSEISFRWMRKRPWFILIAIFIFGSEIVDFVATDISAALSVRICVAQTDGSQSHAERVKS